MYLPSGDHVGEVSGDALSVSLVSPVPFDASTKISTFAPRLAVKARRLPSGDHDRNEKLDRPSLACPIGTCVGPEAGTSSMTESESVNETGRLRTKAINPRDDHDGESSTQGPCAVSWRSRPEARSKIQSEEDPIVLLKRTNTEEAAVRRPRRLPFTDGGSSQLAKRRSIASHDEQGLWACADRGRARTTKRAAAPCVDLPHLLHGSSAARRHRRSEGVSLARVRPAVPTTGIGFLGAGPDVRFLQVPPFRLQRKEYRLSADAR